MQIFWIIGIFILLAVGAGNTAQAKDAQRCMSIETKESRVKCYSSSFDIIESIPKLEGIGVWDVEGYVSKTDGAKEVWLTLYSTNTGIFDYFKEKVRLNITCHKKNSYFSLHFPRKLNSHSGQLSDTTFQLDNQKAFKRPLLTAVKRDVLVLVRDGEAESAVKTLLGSSTLSVGVSYIGGERSTLVFDVSGIENAIKPLAEACQWKI